MKSSSFLSVLSALSVLPLYARAADPQPATVTAVVEIIDTFITNPTMIEAGAVYPIGTAADGQATTYDYEYLDVDQSTTTSGSVTTRVPVATHTMIEGTLVVAPSSWHFENDVIWATEIPKLHNEANCRLLPDGSAECSGFDESFITDGYSSGATTIPPISTRMYTSRGTPRANLFAVSTRAAGPAGSTAPSGSTKPPAPSGSQGGGGKDNAASPHAFMSLHMVGITLAGMAAGFFLVL